MFVFIFTLFLQLESENLKFNRVVFFFKLNMCMYWTHRFLLKKYELHFLCRKFVLLIFPSQGFSVHFENPWLAKMVLMTKKDYGLLTECFIFLWKDFKELETLTVAKLQFCRLVQKLIRTKYSFNRREIFLLINFDDFWNLLKRFK